MLPHPIPIYPTQLPQCALREVKNTIAIASGKGGVGKSTVAVNLAVALARAGARVGLLDADIYGPSIPLMMGLQGSVTTKNQRYLPLFAHGVQTISIGCIAPVNQAMLWRGPMLAKALIQLLDSTAFEALDYLIVDLPPGTGDIQLSLVQKIPLAGAIVVSTPQAISTLDADKAIQLFQRTRIRILGLVENMTEHECINCGHKTAIFGEAGAQTLCEQYHLPLLASIPLQQLLQSHCDQGKPQALDSTSLASQRWYMLALNMAKQLET